MLFRLSKDAKKFLTSQDKQSKKRIYKALRLMTKEPPQGDIDTITESENLF